MIIQRLKDARIIWDETFNSYLLLKNITKRSAIVQSYQGIALFTTKTRSLPIGSYIEVNAEEFTHIKINSGEVVARKDGSLEFQGSITTYKF